MRSVVWLTQVYPRWSSDVFGGFLARLARELPSRGWRVTVVAPAWPGAAARESVADVDVARFDYAGSGRARLAYGGEMHRRAVRHPVALLAFLRSFRRAGLGLVRSGTADLLHAHWWVPGGWVGARVAGETGVPLLISLHGTDIRLLRRWPLLRPLARRVLGAAQCVLPVSRSLDAEADRLGVATGRRILLPMPVDAAVFRPDPDRGAVADPPRFVVVARLTRQKRVADALEAFRRVIAAGVDARLEIAGDGPERARLEALASSPETRNRVTFHGFVPPERLAGLYRSASALVFPAEDEGYGLAIAEAASCAVPTVGVRSGGVLDLVRHDVNGLLVEVGDMDAMADGLRRIAVQAGLAERLGAAALEGAGERTAGPLADRLVSVYDRSVRLPVSGTRP